MAEQETSREAEDLENSLRKLAEKWRDRLKDHLLRSQLKARKVELHPLVKKLLLAFPPTSRK